MYPSRTGRPRRWAMMPPIKAAPERYDEIDNELRVFHDSGLLPTTYSLVGIARRPKLMLTSLTSGVSLRDCPE